MGQDLQIDEIHKISHKIDIVAQTVKIINIEIIIHDQTQTEVFTQIKIQIFLIQTLEIDIIQMTVPEAPHIIETGITQTLEIDNTLLLDHETIQTAYQTIRIITIDRLKIPGIEILIIQIDR